MYSFESRVRYSEVGTDLKLDPLHIAQYMQDCSILHSEDSGRGLGFTGSHHRAWLVASWQIEILKKPELAEHIKISTWPYEFKGMLGFRNFLIENQKGEVCAYANTVWVHYDTEKGMVTRITPDDISGYKVEEKYPMEYMPRKLDSAGAEAVALDPVPVKVSDLDNNNHVNNCSYIRMALNCLPKDTEIRRLRVEYKNQAHFEDTIYPFIHTDGNITTVDLRSADGTIFVIAEFTTGKEHT